MSSDNLSVTSEATTVSAEVASTDSENASTTSAQPDEPLEYPRDFFEIKKGKVPKTAKEAEKYWPFRKNRPRAGVDHEEPDGAAMLREMKGLQEELRKTVQQAFNQKVIEIALSLGLRCGEANQLVKSKEDVRDVIVTWPLNDDNLSKVVKMFFIPFDSREWIATQVDTWLKKKNMKLQPPSDKEKNKFQYERGGFTAVATSAKGDQLEFYMKSLLKEQDWRCIKNKPRGLITTGPNHVVGYLVHDKKRLRFNYRKRRIIAPVANESGGTAQVTTDVWVLVSTEPLAVSDKSSCSFSVCFVFV